ncbi:MAG TPA: DUF1127 domain-containing protein [Hypericibacter adhaerens]|jgi:uncharacterized protein YjiS (DUF1127 family)|uniref:YjiS-like domain-containing protein n=1 Tax=Hypericibacter adhaerens TaxID=2602016 RepID=A0A5J6N6I3_9PROT|nr:DUF1127 domain-containing protein [Hypericibacter adhaerens]QEX24353.1 hypothetical protein FRZ61_42940 [Hypericibacter adhaerens]HWA44768.1 DUF1127 domain-containing protein [Hypericibacter adhaerens]
MTSTFLERDRSVVQTYLQSWGGALRRCVLALRHHGEKRRAAHHLMDCPDHLLRDIGITRRQIAAAVHGRLEDSRCRDAVR